MKIKKRIGICLAVAILTLMISIVSIYYDIKINSWAIYFDTIYLVCGAVAIIFFVWFLIMSEEKIKARKKFFVMTVCFACISSVILGLVSLYALISFVQQGPNMQYYTKNDDSIETDGTVLPTAEEISKKIYELDEKLASGEISQEEYDIAKQTILDELIK